MKESGLIDKWITDRTPKNLQCKGLGPVTTAKIAKLDDFQGAFYVFLSGLLIASIILLFEIFITINPKFILKKFSLKKPKKVSTEFKSQIKLFH